MITLWFVCLICSSFCHQVEQLTKENLELKERMVDLERMIDPVILDKYDTAKSKVSSHFRNVKKYKIQ